MQMRPRPVHLAPLFLFVVSACTTVHTDPEIAVLVPEHFAHDDLHSVLATHVDEQGRVDYPALARDPSTLERYFALIAAISPDSHPQLFPTRQHQLAYWMNAYNGAVLKAVVDAYPIKSVGDVGLPALKAGFFLLQRIPIGGSYTSLYELENAVIRDRFRDPRIHFAINCASASCPRLPAYAFDPLRLEEQLEELSRLFVAEPRNVHIDHAQQTVHLSSIFDWYESDFTDWPADRLPDKADLLDYVSLYAAPHLAAELRKAAGYRVRFTPYDWSLNDQALGAALE